jgi:hypothetical protein
VPQDGDLLRQRERLIPFAVEENDARI